ncbi:hypothetical protein [Dietzia sp.]|uniref:hypothetical protein n=1 Tax=Dietzia sp. TaxID=1871616 RepID=UPI002FDA06F8
MKAIDHGEETNPTSRRKRRFSWSVRLALLAVVVALPSSIWRILMIYGRLPGTEAFRDANSGDTGYVLALTVIEMLAAFAVLALTLGWFRPIARHTPMPWWLPGALGFLGGAVITWMFSYSMVFGTLGGSRPDQGLVHGGALVLMVAVYAPLLVWGPLTLGASAEALARDRKVRRGKGPGELESVVGEQLTPPLAPLADFRG